MDPISSPSGVGLPGATTPAQPRTARNGELGRDEFLQLMVAQLKNQSPLNPQNGTEFVAQMAQFSSLDQLVGIKDMLRYIAGRLTAPPTGPESHDTPFGRTHP